MNGSPVGITSFFLQPVEPPRGSSEPHVERGENVLTSAEAPTTLVKKVSSSVFFPGLESGKEINFTLRALGALRKGGSMVKRKKSIDKDELSEDYCFVCKDGGDIRVCDFKACLKSYHPQCLQKDNSFLESGERWTCGWHSCYNCHKNSTFKCFCCSFSSCRACIRGSELVLVKGTKGFCNNCLSLVKLIEENADVNSDGEAVDFDDTDTYEFLFKDYWKIVKEKEGLTSCNLQAANGLLNGGEKLNLSDSDENFEGQAERSDDDCDNEAFPPKNFMRKQSDKAVKDKSKSKKMTYIGWASKELIEFLIFLGKDTQLPLGQHDVCEIVKEYVQSNNLLRHNKKKKQQVFCDARLLSLFRRKKVSLFKVYSLLEKHLSENNDSDDESFSLEDDDYEKSVKKQRREKSTAKQCMGGEHFKENTSEPRKKCFAAITESNINLIYLKRSLIMELMKDPKTFENKVVGCFVRRECDPKDSYHKEPYGHRPPKTYKLNQITGVKKATEEYKLGDMTTDIVLCVSNYWKVVQMSMLSDDKFEEEECQDLRQLVKKGLFKRPSVDEIKEKIRAIHEDMVLHSVKKELLRLEKQIVRANEKGWRKELFDCIERKKLLNKPEEIMRLMKEMPDVVADLETEATEGVIQSTMLSVITTTNSGPIKERNGALRSLHGNDLILAKEKHEVVYDTGPSSTVMDATISDKIVTEKNEGHDNSASKENVGRVVIDVGDEDKADDRKVPASHANQSWEKIWNYKDPSGTVQGPFSLTTLKYWKEQGFFDEDFAVWRASQSQEDAAPLVLVLNKYVSA